MGGSRMNELDYLDAISELTNKVGFKIKGTDLKTLELFDGSTIPTEKQIQDKIKEMQLVKESATTQKAAAKAALLIRLNITEDEAKLLLS
jgi:hypothetical protein